MVRVYINPDYFGAKPHADNGGIRRVCEAMLEHLPKFDIEVVHDPKQAHIVCNHGGALLSVPGIPSVVCNHGLYWSRQKWGPNYQDVNRQVIETMAHAVAHTAPSQWVANAIRRGMLAYPEVVYHGIDADKFLPGKINGGYVAWNKARADAVSNPGDMMDVAALLPNRQFRTTIGLQTDNVQVVGGLPHDQMKKFVSEAGVYLSTVRETFGIGVLEAMAYGIPIAGFGWGGNSEIVIQGETGYLAPPGDFPALADCIERCYAERERLSANCVEDARTRWQWEPRIEQYANIFKRVYKTYYERESKPKVSVVVTAYKLDPYLPACLESISNQSYTDFECLVVDDAQLQSTEMIVNEFTKRDPRIRYTPTPHNMKLPGARNFGFSQASGLYIRHMDADDILMPDALGLEAQSLDQDPGIHIAYGHLEVIRENGDRILERGQPVRNGWPGNEFNWFAQMAHLNQLPSTCMVRRSVFERSDGYRERMKRAEDAEFWCRVTSLGFRAKKITQAVTMLHRERADSKGATEWQVEGKEPDWTAWFPWRMGAGDYSEGRMAIKKFGDAHPSPHLVPFGAQGMPSNLRSWMVHDYSYPVVSIIVTCGPGHKPYLLDALDSIQAQTYPDWECIVVNDSGAAWGPDIAGAPWAKVVNMDGNQGVSAARNKGFEYANGRFIIWMDCDDYWFSWLLERMVACAEKNYGVVYSDLIKSEIIDGKEKFSVYRYPEFQCERAAHGMQYAGSSVLYPRKAVQSVVDSQGGYDTVIPGMEDKDHQIAVHANGFCAYPIHEPLFVYRMNSSTKREKDYTVIDEITAYLNEKWFDYKTGVLKMGCGCATAKKSNNTPTSLLSSSGNFSPDSLAQISQAKSGQPNMVELEYVGPIQETFTIRSIVDRNVNYRFGNNEHHRMAVVFLADAERLMGSVNEKGVPNYRIVAAGAVAEAYDPTKFLGAALESA